MKGNGSEYAEVEAFERSIDEVLRDVGSKCFAALRRANCHVYLHIARLMIMQAWEYSLRFTRCQKRVVYMAAFAVAAMTFTQFIATFPHFFKFIPRISPIS